MKRRGRYAEAPRIAADLVEGEQPDIAVEGGVLGGFGHDRPGDLLEVHRHSRSTSSAAAGAPLAAASPVRMPRMKSKMLTSAPLRRFFACASAQSI